MIPASFLGGEAGDGDAHAARGQDRGKIPHGHDELHAAKAAGTHDPGDIDLEDHLYKPKRNTAQSQKHSTVKHGVSPRQGLRTVSAHETTSSFKVFRRVDKYARTRRQCQNAWKS